MTIPGVDAIAGIAILAAVGDFGQGATLYDREQGAVPGDLPPILADAMGLSYSQALRRLKRADDSIREALGENLEPTLRKLLGSKQEKASS